MYKSRSIIPNENIVNSGIYIQLTMCYEIHSVTINLNGYLNEKYGNFEINPHYVDFRTDMSHFKGDPNQFGLDINYHYKKSSHEQACQNFANNIIQSSCFNNQGTVTSDIKEKRYL